MIKRFVNKQNRGFQAYGDNSAGAEENSEAQANRINPEKPIQDDFGDYTDYEELK